MSVERKNRWSTRAVALACAGVVLTMTGAAFAAVPLYDLLTVIVIRLKSGRSIFSADKNHFSHRLVELGLTKPQAVLTVYLTTATCCLAALLLHRVDTVGAVILMLIVGCILSLIAILETTARRKINQP